MICCWVVWRGRHWIVCGYKGNHVLWHPRSRSTAVLPQSLPSSRIPGTTPPMADHPRLRGSQPLTYVSPPSSTPFLRSFPELFIYFSVNPPLFIYHLFNLKINIFIFFPTNNSYFPPPINLTCGFTSECLYSYPPNDRPLLPIHTRDSHPHRFYLVTKRNCTMCRQSLASDFTTRLQALHDTGRKDQPAPTLIDPLMVGQRLKPSKKKIAAPGYL